MATNYVSDVANRQTDKQTNKIDINVNVYVCSLISPWVPQTSQSTSPLVMERSLINTASSPLGRVCCLMTTGLSKDIRCHV